MIEEAVFIVLFSVFAIVRSSLRAGLFAHNGHDLFARVTLALLKSCCPVQATNDETRFDVERLFTFFPPLHRFSLDTDEV
jgi:hypothetical protein